MINLTINGKAIQAQEEMTILQAAAANGIRIPSLCNLPDVHEFGTCRICSVEVTGAKAARISRERRISSAAASGSREAKSR